MDTPVYTITKNVQATLISVLIMLCIRFVIFQTPVYIHVSLLTVSLRTGVYEIIVLHNSYS